MRWVVVFDTNILIAALLSLRGPPFRCLALAKEGVVQSVTCQEILEEFQEKLVGKFSYALQRAHAAATEVRGVSRLVTITHHLNVVTADPDDDKVVECAVVGDATHIVTGDRRHLLPLSSYQGIAIVSAADFLALVTASSAGSGQPAEGK
jgi:putative PIN family toxin of toxin-antitoxin system